MDIMLVIIGFLGGIISVVTFLVKLIFKKGWSKKTSGFIFLGSLVLFIVGGIMGGNSVTEEMNKITSEDIAQLAEEGNNEKLISYIEFYDSETDNSKANLVNEAIDIIVDNKVESGISKLEEIFFDEVEKKSDYIYLGILEAYNSSDLVFESSDKMYEMLLNKSTPESIKTEVASMIKNYDKKETVSYFAEKIIKLKNEENIQGVTEIIDLLKSLEIASNEKLNEVIDLIDSLNGKKDEIEEFNKQISELEERINELDAITPSETVFELHGYMVHKIDDEYYEFAFTTYDSYWGELPTENHALLKTTLTEFQSKGTFDLLVIEKGEEEIELVEEAGGFTQTWKIYEEVAPDTIDNINLINSLYEECSSLEVQLEDRNVNLDYIKENLDAILNDIDGLLQ